MIYLVSLNQTLFESPEYQIMTKEEALFRMRQWKEVQFDSETSGRNPHLCKVLCIQFGNDESDCQIVVDTTTIPLEFFREILETKLIIVQNGKFDYQFLFNYGIIPTRTWDCMVAEQILYLGYDNAYFHVSLKAICERRFGIDIDKTVRGEIIWRGLDDRVIVYAAGDVMYLQRIRNEQIKEAREKHVLTAIEIENRFVVVCAYLEWCGIMLDVNKWATEVISANERKLKEAKEALDKFVVNLYHQDKHKTTEETFYKISEDNHGYKESFELPKNCTIIGTPIREVTMFGVIEYWQKIRMRSQWADWIEVNLQGDLFSGFDTEPHCAINWASSKQLIPFFQYLGFSTKAEDKKTGATKNSITEKVLAKQKGINDEFLDLYLEYKKAEKVCSTYGQNYIDAINPKTGRIHTTFKQIGASSSRMSCGGGTKATDADLAHFKGIAPSRCKYVQLQNLPHDELTRSCFIAGPGNLMVSADFSALESRLGADIYNEPEMIEEFLHRSGDMHSLCAKIVFKKELEGIPVDQVKKLRPDLRTKVKPIEFSQQFGGGAKAVANALGCSKAEATEFVKAYADGFKGIAEFKKRGSEFVRKNGYIVICKHTGLKIFWEDWPKWRAVEDTPEIIRSRELTKDQLNEHNFAAAKWDRMALNSPTQGTGAEIIKMSATLFFKWICKEGLFGKVRICDMVHDEIVCEFPEELKDIVPNKLKECMEKAAEAMCKSLPIPADPAVGTYWIH